MKIQDSDVRTLLDLSPICNKIIDLEGKLRYMSMAGIQMLKIENVHEHYGLEYPVSFFPAEVRNSLRICCQRALEGERCSTETRAMDTQGKEVWLSSTFVPVFDEGEVAFVIASSVDISEQIHHRNHLEKTVNERTNEKTELQHQLFQAQKTRAIGSLAAGIAHDFNNVLGIILGTVDLQKHYIRKGKFSMETLNDCFANIVNVVNRASELSDQLIGFAKQGKYDMQAVNVNKLVDELDNLLRKNLTSTRKITLSTDLKAVSFVDADAVQVHQVIQNLVVNARDALPDGGDIFISTRDEVVETEKLSFGDTITPGRYVVISVRDDGIGIEDDILANIFDPYFTTKSREAGTGLGLASVWGIVCNHGGYICVTSRIGEGTTFEIYFPYTDPIDEVVEIKEKSTVPSFSSRVLVVDDEPVIRDFVKEYFIETGLDVFTACNGEEALRIYASEPIDLVLADLVMSPMDGLELFFKIRKINNDANVYLMSGYQKDNKVKEALNDGALGFIKKPFQLDELKSAVQNSLQDKR